ncbi:tRNA G18 (ribose-2'-O)-methylase SpoU [Arboricoccus pini]|uniref:tRNA G18 (Ribose-2'-O)-methylase SpoU n=1 Tax=Arboricoccus pini TaxID=1963835 RepID=A0A212RCA1_9PROT|nr:TrmH family RNA methyltransferase [Arboricoccus pini]SNB69713.1 tRNA G18 (ribose-2'-O)-methylase SpoU [Arboricoccus pini]
MESQSFLLRVHAAYKDPALVVLEGLHALKHAIRFKAEVELALTADASVPEGLAARLAPDILPQLRRHLVEVPADVFARLAPKAPASGIIAIARRPDVTLQAILERPGPVVLLDRPTHPGNVGAVVRVSAAAAAAGVLTTGQLDPWGAPVLRGSAGLHFALPVLRIEDLGQVSRPILALHPEGQPLTAESLRERPILVFGSERRGLDPSWLQRADRRLTIPMAAGVSSLNLATSVAVTLYADRLGSAC